MTLAQRKKRDLERDTPEFRDDRLFVIACDDTYAPKQYFNFFKIARIKVHFLPTEDGESSANHVVERLENFKNEESLEKDDELWVLLDTDHYVKDSHSTQCG